jgi:hypothetical protein
MQESTDGLQDEPAYNMARVLNDKLKAAGTKYRPTGWHIHFYKCCNVDGFKTAIGTWKEWQNRVLGGGETWLTEFGSLSGVAGIDGFMKPAVNWIEENTNPAYLINRYAWYGVVNGENPLSINSSLTSLGTTYSNLPAQGPRPTPPPCQGTLTPTIPNPTATQPPTNPTPTPTTTLPTATPIPPSTTPTGTRKPGDANSDSKVDGADYVIWLNHLGAISPSGSGEGDFNSDSKVDGADYVIWLNNFQSL